MITRAKPIRFTDEHINSDDPSKTVSDSEITINSIEHHLSHSITSVENLKVINIKRNLVLKIENLKDEITSIQKDIEPKFDKHFIETINQREGENKKLNDKIKLLETENKILKHDIVTK